MTGKARLSAIWAPVVLLDAAVVLTPAVTGVSAMWLGFLFLAGSCASCAGYLVLAPSPDTNRAAVWASVRSQARTKLFALAMLGRASHWLILAAVALAGPTVAAAVWGLGPLGWALLLYLTAVGTSGRRRYQRFTLVSGPGAVAAWAGVLRWCCRNLWRYEPRDGFWQPGSP